MNMKPMLMMMALMATSISAFAQNENANTRQAAEAFFHKYDQMINKGDLNGYMGLLTKDYTSVDKQGKSMNKAELRAYISGMMPSSRNFHSVTTVKNVQLQSEEASVWVVNVMTMEQKVNGRWQKVKMTSRFCETLTRAEGPWKIKYSQELMTDEPWSFKTN